MWFVSARLILESTLFSAVARHATLASALLFNASLCGGSLAPLHPIRMIRGDPFRIFGSPVSGRVPHMVAVEVAMPVWMISLNPRRLILPPPPRRVPFVLVVSAPPLRMILADPAGLILPPPICGIPISSIRSAPPVGMFLCRYRRVQHFPP